MTSVNANDTAEDSEPETTGPVTAATTRFISTAEAFDEDALREPTLCPGWSRAHILTHVARHAEAMVRLLTWARTGSPTYQYESAEQRRDDIEAGVGKSPTELIDDLRNTAETLARAVNEMPDEAWSQTVRRGPGGNGDPMPARRVLWARLLELEVHHVDLQAGYSPTDWAPAFIQRAAAETARTFSRRADVMPFKLATPDWTEMIGDTAATTVSGPADAALAWLIGRSAGAELTASPSGDLPVLPAWK